MAVGVLAEVAEAVAVGVGVLASVTDWRHYYRRDSTRETAPTTCDRRPLCAHKDCWRLGLTSVENYSRVVDFKRIAGNGWRSRLASSERRAEPAQHTWPQALELARLQTRPLISSSLLPKPRELAVRAGDRSAGGLFHVEHLDRKAERTSDIAGRGCDGRCANDWRDSDEYSASGLRIDANLTCGGQVQQIRRRRRMNRDQRGDPHKH
jgi:hypothetical protein